MGNNEEMIDIVKGIAGEYTYYNFIVLPMCHVFVCFYVNVYTNLKFSYFQERGMVDYLYQIFRCLDVNSMKNAALVSKEWRDAIALVQWKRKINKKVSIIFQHHHF